MYKNRIRHITPNSHPQFFIPRSAIAFDERLPFIESVLETLLESRFGPGSVYHSVLRSSDRPEPGAEPLYDLFDVAPNGLIPYDTVSPLGRAGYQAAEAAYRRAKQMGIVAATSHGTDLAIVDSLHLGRGSP